MTVWIVANNTKMNGLEPEMIKLKLNFKNKTLALPAPSGGGRGCL